MNDQPTQEDWIEWADAVQIWAVTAIKTLRIMKTQTFDGEPIAKPLEEWLLRRPDRVQK